MKTTHQISFPTQTTYWIAYTDSSIFAYGECAPQQEMQTGQPLLFSTTNREEWVEKLYNEFNTQIQEEL